MTVVVGGVEVKMAVPLDVVKSNIKENTRLYLKEVSKLPEFRRRKTVAIVGGGPSLKNEIGKLHQYNTIIACGSVHDYLMRENIAPTYTVICDPDPIVTKYITNVSCFTQFLVASQCDPSVIKYLRERTSNIAIWHCGMDIMPDAEIFGENKVVINGGCTVGMRAIVIAYEFGFDYMDLFGFDTCISGEGLSHAYSFVEPDRENIDNILDICVGPVKFRMAEYHLGQLLDFQKILKIMADKVHFRVHGEGALKTLLDLGREEYEKCRKQQT